MLYRSKFKLRYYPEGVSRCEGKRTWFQKNLVRHALKDVKCHTQIDIDYSDDIHVQKAIDDGLTVYHAEFFGGIRANALYIADWLAELEQRDERLFKRLNRVNFSQTLKHSGEWWLNDEKVKHSDVLSLRF